MADLTDPSERYRDSYLEALQEFQAEGRHLEIPLEEVAVHFADFVQQLCEQVPGRVPYSYFWLIDGNDYIGRLILRYGVNEHLLQMGGHIGYEIRPSRRIIEFYGGMLENIIEVEQWPVKVYRYWIQL